MPLFSFYLKKRVLKEKKKSEKIFVDSQEKAFWATIRPSVSSFGNYFEKMDFY